MKPLIGIILAMVALGCIAFLLFGNTNTEKSSTLPAPTIATGSLHNILNAQ